jgi:DNA mismatch repair ATPase MutS
MDAKMDEKGDIEYNYTISKGISTIQGAVKVLRDMEYPEEIISTIMEYDNETDNETDKEKEKEKIVETKKSRKSKK